MTFAGGKNSDNGMRILAVRLGAMGDVIHTLPAVASLKHSFPGCRVTWAIEPRWADLLAGNPFIDHVATVDRSGLGRLLASWRRLRREKYDFAVDFQGLVKSALVASAARPERIFGFHTSQVRERLAALFYSNRARARAAHVVDRNIDLAVAAGAASVLRSFPIPPGARQGPLPEQRYVLACPTAGWRAKQWPIEYYEELATLLWREAGMRLVIDSAPGGIGLLRGPSDAFRHFSSLPGLIYAMRRAVAFVGVDSGPLHLAAALNKPGVAIFGPTDPARNGPYGGSLTVLRSPGAVTSYKRRQEIDPAMRAITPALVFAELKAQFERHPHAADCLG